VLEDATAKPPTQQKFDVDDLFGSDSDSEDSKVGFKFSSSRDKILLFLVTQPAPKQKPASRLKKAGEKAPKKKVPADRFW
jgi:hypothetical protein